MFPYVEVSHEDRRWLLRGLDINAVGRSGDRPRPDRRSREGLGNSIDPEGAGPRVKAPCPRRAPLWKSCFSPPHLFA